MLLALLMCVLVSVVTGQDEGVCECGLFARIQESGILPPNSRVVGPLYIFENTEDVSAPCNGNVASVCSQYCDYLLTQWKDSGNDFDTEVEIEVAPGVFQNETIGQVMCTRSYQLAPNPGDYEGTGEDGTSTRMHMQLTPCQNWQYRACYDDLVLCCDAEYQYTSCDGPVVCE